MTSTSINGATNNNEIVIPTIRLDDPDSDRLVASLRKACIEIGFFYLEGHGISLDLIQSVKAHARQLFALPFDEKQNLVDRTLLRGYLAKESTDPDHSTVYDTKESFDMALDIPERDDPKLVGPNVWPNPSATPSYSDCEEFQKIMTDYLHACSQVSFRLVQLLALAIGMEDSHYFDQDFSDPIVGLRLLRYDTTLSRPQEGVFAAGAHTDLGIVTLLLTETPGLQISLSKQKQKNKPEEAQETEEDWIDVPPPIHDETTFVVNLGDMLERWTNGLFASTRHRVLNKTGQVRYSVPFFYKPNYEALVSPLDICCCDTNPPSFRPTICGKHYVAFTRKVTDLSLHTSNQEEKDA